MDEHNLKLLSNLTGVSYGDIAQKTRNSFSNRIKVLLEHKRIPKTGFSDNEIELLIREFSNMDANNFHSFTGIGEREGRIYSNLVKNRHFNLSHGIGRSGDLSSLQPKAAGSNAISKLANALILNLLHEMGMKSMKKALIVPMATGMTLVLTMMSLRCERPNAKYVIWPRIDQRSCFKSIIAAGLKPIIIEPVQIGDELQTNTVAIKDSIESVGRDNVLCVLTTTSCFAPRVPDNIIKVSKICSDIRVPHIINNAYGVALKRCMNVIEESCRQYGKLGVHAVVQSTDKNLMVPVGGAIVVSCDAVVIDAISRTYAGRASSTPSLDVLITLLSMGLDGYKDLVKTRENNFQYLKEELVKVSLSFGLRLMETSHNPISLALVLKSSEKHSTTYIGSQLFHRSISGARIVESAASNPKITTIESYDFVGFGSHSSQSTCDYINAAAAIGQTRQEIDRFIHNLRKLLLEFYESEKGDVTPVIPQ